jgi:hypothetical protein
MAHDVCAMTASLSVIATVPVTAGLALTVVAAPEACGSEMYRLPGWRGHCRRCRCRRVGVAVVRWLSRVQLRVRTYGYYGGYAPRRYSRSATMVTDRP